MYIILAGALLFIIVGVVVYMYKEAHKDTIEVRKVAIQGVPDSLAGLNIFSFLISIVESYQES